MSGAHLKLTPTQRAPQDADETLSAARRALAYAVPAISRRPAEAERLAVLAVERLDDARTQLAALFDKRVSADDAY